MKMETHPNLPREPLQPPPKGRLLFFGEMRARGWGKTMMQMEEDRRNDEGR